MNVECGKPDSLNSPLRRGEGDGPGGGMGVVLEGKHGCRNPQVTEPPVGNPRPHRGVASGSPPSTGIVAPVVGVCRDAKKSTAFATWSAVTSAFNRFRLR